MENDFWFRTVESFTLPKDRNIFSRVMEMHQRNAAAGNSLFIQAKAYAKSAEIQGVDGDVRLSDNFFDLNPGVKRVEIVEGDAARFTLKSVCQIR